MTYNKSVWQRTEDEKEGEIIWIKKRLIFNETGRSYSVVSPSIPSVQFKKNHHETKGYGSLNIWRLMCFFPQVTRQSLQM